MENKNDGGRLSDGSGYFGAYGGSFLPPQLQPLVDEIAAAYLELKDDETFKEELASLYKHYVGRPSPVFHAARLSAAAGGAEIFLKREDLNHTGAHKINHCLGEALLARRMGKKRLIAETGAGQHGVALAAAAALLGLECRIYMGEVDMRKERPNVGRMRILGAEVVPVAAGRRTLKDAVDAALDAYAADPVTQFYAIGSVVGPHPFPTMVRDFQAVVGREAKRQMMEMTGRLPDALVACVGGGSNAIGLFSSFLEDKEVAIYGVEPSGTGFKDGEHAATLTKGRPGILHGFRSYLLQGAQGQPLKVYSAASGLDYPGVGPEHSYLKDSGRVKYECASDAEAISAFFELSRKEGIIPAIESSHAVAYALKLAAVLGKRKSILVNLSGRGDKDVDYVLEKYGTSFSALDGRA